MGRHVLVRALRVLTLPCSACACSEQSRFALATRSFCRKSTSISFCAPRARRRGVLPDGKGENKLGLLLQERRTQLAAPPPTPPPPPPPAAVSEPASGAAAPSTAAPGAKRRKVEPEVLVVD